MFQVRRQQSLSDAVLEADLKAVVGRDFYDDGYFEALAKEQFPVLERRINDSISAVADHRRVGGRRTAAASAGRPRSSRPVSSEAAARPLSAPGLAGCRNCPRRCCVPDIWTSFSSPRRRPRATSSTTKRPTKKWSTMADDDGLLNRLTFGLYGRVRRRFSALLLEAEEWRHRRHEVQPEPAGLSSSDCVARSWDSSSSASPSSACCGTCGRRPRCARRSRRICRRLKPTPSFARV